MHNKVYSIIFSSAVIAGTIFAPSYAYGNEIVNQGDRVITKRHNGEHGVCTIGYVDKATQTAIYTGHCSGGEVGNKVMDYNWNEIGYVVQNFYQIHETYTDYAVIKLTRPAGNNIYSGNKISLLPAFPGDNICSYGGNTNDVYCGKVTGSENMTVVKATRNSGGSLGDSGGPAWISGKGVVGFFSAVTDTHTYFSYPLGIALKYIDRGINQNDFISKTIRQWLSNFSNFKIPTISIPFF